MIRLLLPLLALCIASPAMAADIPAADIPAAARLDDARSQALYFTVIAKLRQDGKSHAALAYLDDFDRRYPGDMKARLLRADCLLGIGGLVQAEALYRSLIAGPEGAAAQSGLGHVAAARGDWAAAVAAHRRAAAIDPVNAAYRNDLGYALLRAGNRDGALFALRQASELDPANAVIAANLTLALGREDGR